MRIISVYDTKDKRIAWIEEWNGERRRSKQYQATQASVDRLASVLNIWRSNGQMSVRPFLGGHIGYVAEEITND